jgi:FtsZ-binding cell division protein ZapB
MVMKDTTKVILAVLGGIIVGARLQALVDLKKIAILKQDIDSLKTSKNQVIDERNEYAKKVDDLRRDNFVLQHCNDAQGMLLIEQQREIKDLRRDLYN